MGFGYNWTSKVNDDQLTQRLQSWRREWWPGLGSNLHHTVLKLDAQGMCKSSNLQNYRQVKFHYDRALLSYLFGIMYILICIVKIHTYRSTINFADPRPTRCHTPFTSWLFHVQPFGLILKTSIYPNPGIIIYHWVYTLISIRYDCWLNFNNYPIHLIFI